MAKQVDLSLMNNLEAFNLGAGDTSAKNLLLYK